MDNNITAYLGNKTKEIQNNDEVTDVKLDLRSQQNKNPTQSTSSEDTQFYLERLHNIYRSKG